MRNLLKFSLIFLLLVSPVYADVASLEGNYVAGQTNIVDKLNDDRTKLTNSINNIRGTFAGSTQTSGQIKADTIGEENMADDSNPRIRTAEGASCNGVVYSGFTIPTSASLVGTIASGIGYPAGYRINKTDSTAHTFTASKWTWVYLNSAGSFQYQEGAIGSSTPAIPANSAVIARVSTDATTINTVTDLRLTSCAAGPFDNIADATGEANLDDLLRWGTPVRQFSNAGKSEDGFAQGAIVSWDTHTTFKVTKGSMYIDGEFRSVSQDVSVATTNDDPSNGISGLDAGAIGNSTKYYVYAIADQDAVKTFSVSYSSNATAPAGVTNSRLIGTIQTDANGKFMSRDVLSTHAIAPRELAGGWVYFNGYDEIIVNGYNVSSITDEAGNGVWTVTWDYDFLSADYVVVMNAARGDGSSGNMYSVQAQAAGTTKIKTADANDAGQDCAVVQVLAIGDTRR